jgi:hypothetical protein
LLLMVRAPAYVHLDSWARADPLEKTTRVSLGPKG